MFRSALFIACCQRHGGYLGGEMVKGIGRERVWWGGGGYVVVSSPSIASF